KFSIGDRLQAHVFLLLDHTLYFSTLDLFELRGRDFPFSALLTGFLQGGRAKQTAHVVGTKWRLFTLRHSLTPDFLSELDNQPELGPLLVFRKNIALFRGSEATLRRQTKLLQRHEFSRLIDAAPDVVFRFQPA